MESSTDVNAASSANLSGGASKKLDDGIPVVSGQKAPVTATVLTAVIISVMHSFNFGIAIGAPNNSAVAMQEVRGSAKPSDAGAAGLESAHGSIHASAWARGCFGAF